MPHGVIARHIRRVSRGPASLVFLVVAGVSVLGAGQPAGANRIDTIAPMAPELAPYGSQASGVRTIVVTDRHRPDIRNTKPGAPTVFADRRLTLEVWYPASLPASVAQHGTYRALVRDGKTTVTLHGRAVRDAAPAAGPFPLVILSHGHPGSPS
jgi:hypothetical protein